MGDICHFGAFVFAAKNQPIFIRHFVCECRSRGRCIVHSSADRREQALNALAVTAFGRFAN